MFSSSAVPLERATKQSRLKAPPVASKGIAAFQNNGLLMISPSDLAEIHAAEREQEITLAAMLSVLASIVIKAGLVDETTFSAAVDLHKEAFRKIDEQRSEL